MENSIIANSSTINDLKLTIFQISNIFTDMTTILEDYKKRIENLEKIILNHEQEIRCLNIQNRLIE